MKKNKKDIDHYLHQQKRKNIPEVGLVSNRTDKIQNIKTKYNHDPYIEPYLSWAGKKEGENFDIQETSLHIHEKIDPR